jgi:hypothetical protein
MRGKKSILFSMISATVDLFVKSLFFCDIVLHHSCLSVTAVKDETCGTGCLEVVKAVFKNVDLNYKNCFNIGTDKLSDISFAGLTTVWVNKTRSILSSSLFMLVLWQHMPLFWL